MDVGDVLLWLQTFPTKHPLLLAGVTFVLGLLFSTLASSFTKPLRDFLERPSVRVRVWREETGDSASFYFENGYEDVELRTDFHLGGTRGWKSLPMTVASGSIYLGMSADELRAWFKLKGRKVGEITPSMRLRGYECSDRIEIQREDLESVSESADQSVFIGITLKGGGPRRRVLFLKKPGAMPKRVRRWKLLQWFRVNRVPKKAII